MEGVEVFLFFSAIWSYVKENEKKLFKFQDIKTSKIKKSNFVRILETKIQEKFAKIREQFVGGVAFRNLGFHRVSSY